MASVFVQADDFSGAAEVGYCFVEHGLSAQVLLGAGDSRETSDGGTSAGSRATDPRAVVIADTHSRGLLPFHAGTLVKKAFTGTEASTAQVVFKKIDSLWRGNVHAEITALAGLGFHTVVAGALPHMGRAVVDGRPLVAGVPLADTDLWHAEATDAPSHLATLLRPEAPEHVRTAGLELVRSGLLSAALASLLDSAQPQLVVVDGETVQDLERVVDALIGLGFGAGGRRIALVGTGGAADVLARRLAAQHAAPTSVQPTAIQQPAQPPKVARNAQATNLPGTEPHPTAGPVLAVVGSASRTAHAQLAKLEDAGFTVVRLDVTVGDGAAYAHQLAGARQVLRDGKDLAVAVAAGAPEPGKGRAIVGALSRFAAKAAAAARADLILTGGETAREVLDGIGCLWLEPIAAVQHGAVLSRADDGTLVGTKPGSFGDDLALLQLYEEIRKRRRPSTVTPANILTRKNLEQQ